jgi:hypothetical protein
MLAKYGRTDGKSERKIEPSISHMHTHSSYILPENWKYNCCVEPETLDLGKKVQLCGNILNTGLIEIYILNIELHTPMVTWKQE